VAEALHVLENVIHRLPSMDPRERRSECGRLILSPDALHYVPGWEVHQPNIRIGIFGANEAIEILLALASRAPDHVDTRGEGARLLAGVRSLAPADQVRTIAGSVTVPSADIDSARLSFLASILKIVTEARGEVLEFVIARRHRPPVKAWLAGLARK
jgi:hypothetical protein